MAHGIAEELRRVQEELRVVKAELVALRRVVEESVLFQAWLASDRPGVPRERIVAAVRVLRKVVAMDTVQQPAVPGLADAAPQRPSHRQRAWRLGGPRQCRPCYQTCLIPAARLATMEARLHVPSCPPRPGLLSRSVVLTAPARQSASRRPHQHQDTIRLVTSLTCPVLTPSWHMSYLRHLNGLLSAVSLETPLPLTCRPDLRQSHPAHPLPHTALRKWTF
jgi:hypothetical protein